VIKPDEDLDKLEEDIRRLKSKYDQFFTRITKVPPMHDRKQVEILIYEISKQKMRDNTRRFRFNTILGRYNQYRELWGRKMREREEGPMEFRRRQAALKEPVEAPAPPPPRAAAKRVTSSGSDPYVKLAPGSNGEAIRDLYNQIEKENQKLGKAPNMTFDQLRSVIEKQSEAVRSRYNVDVVGFRVDVVDGKVKLKAKPM
jgi:hypothetical protein